MLREWGMATPGQLVQAMADVLGIPAVTVAVYDRQLSEAGLRTKSGRGTSAAKVTSTDIANLLMAILGSPVFGPSIKTAAQTCEKIGSSYIIDGTDNLETFSKIELKTLAALPKRHTFREAFVAIIDGAVSGAIHHDDLFIQVDRPDLRATIGFIHSDWVNSNNFNNFKRLLVVYGDLLTDRRGFGQMTYVRYRIIEL